MDGMLLNRRRVLTLGATTPLAAAGLKRDQGAGAVSVTAATVDILRVCNTDYYPAAERLLRLAPGQGLEVGFAYDPAFVEQASAGLWLDGEKVGDAPRRSREWLGRMVRAGRRLSATVQTIRPATDYSGPACMVRIELTRSETGAPSGWAISETFLEAEAGAQQAERYAAAAARLRGGGAVGPPPVFLGGAQVSLSAQTQLAPGEPLRVVSGPRGGLCETWAGTPVGELCADEWLMAGRMAEAGLRLCAVVLAPSGAPRNQKSWASVAVYLLD